MVAEMTDSNTAEEQSSYFIAEEDASNLLFQFIRKKIMNKKHVACGMWHVSPI